MRYWLMKTEPDEFSIDDLAKKKVEAWTGVRNYQARNFMRDGMQVGDGVLFYHSSCAEPGVAGIAEIASEAHPDPSQFDKKSDYYDPKSKKDKPRWVNVDVRAVRKTRLISLNEMRNHKALAKMVTLRPGNRLSITPVTADEWEFITRAMLKDRPQ